MLRYLLPLVLLFCATIAHSREVESKQPQPNNIPSNKGHQALFDRNFGLSFGVLQGSAYDLFNAELTYIAMPQLHLSLAMGITDLHTVLDGYVGSNDTRTVALKARHHIRPIPIFFRVDVGALMYSAENDSFSPIMHSETNFYLANGVIPDKEDDDKFTGYTPYVSAAIGVYYFWSIGLYVETTLIGYNYAPKTIIMKPKERDNEFKELRKDLTGHSLFGMFGEETMGILNFRIGLML